MDLNTIRFVGAQCTNGNCTFTVWAPFSSNVQLIIKNQNEPIDLEKDQWGYWQIHLERVSAGTQYMFLLDGTLKRADPASLSQPEGVHSWSEVVDHKEHKWSDSSWAPPALEDMIIYELHVGTFTPEGTFEAIIDQLDHLLDLGVNAIEIMPIAQFPGNRNWGYDGVYPFAAQNSYGSVGKLKHLVDKCHQKNIAVILDVVYNHMGPEGNYLSDFGPYFTDKYHTPWGSALNFDDQYSGPVRDFFLQNALTWLRDFHFDGLRLDAVHAIMDNGPVHLLKELRMRVDQLEKETGRKYSLIAESDMNDVKLISHYQVGGYKLDGQWVDDFHHAVHSLATGEMGGYYEDYGEIRHLAKCFKQGFIYDGTYSFHRKKRVGNSPADMSPGKFVVAIQNHDQVGNRMIGERLSQLVSFQMLKLAIGTMLISPFVPMLFMGEEYGEDQPFLYFVSHTDPALVKAVQEGRKKEFEAFQWQGEVPDPQSEETFLHSKLSWGFSEDISKRTIFNFYKQLITLRKEGAFIAFRTETISSKEQDKMLVLMTEQKSDQLMAILNFNHSPHNFKVPKKKKWRKIIASSDETWDGHNDAVETINGGEELSVPPATLMVYKSV